MGKVGVFLYIRKTHGRDISGVKVAAGLTSFTRRSMEKRREGCSLEFLKKRVSIADKESVK